MADFDAQRKLDPKMSDKLLNPISTPAPAPDRHHP